MWMIQIMADESDAAPLPHDSLPALLAAHGIPPEMIRCGLDQLRRSKSVRLCKPAAERGWEIWEGLDPSQQKPTSHTRDRGMHTRACLGSKAERRFIDVDRPQVRSHSDREGPVEVLPQAQVHSRVP